MSDIIKTTEKVGSKGCIPTKKLLESGEKIEALDYIDG